MKDDFAGRLSAVMEAGIVGSMLAIGMRKLSDAVPESPEAPMEVEKFMNAFVYFVEGARLLEHIIVEHGGKTEDELHEFVNAFVKKHMTEVVTHTPTNPDEADPMGPDRREKAGDN